MSPSFCFSWHRLLRRTPVLWELYSTILKRNEKSVIDDSRIFSTSVRRNRSIMPAMQPGSKNTVEVLGIV